MAGGGGGGGRMPPPPPPVDCLGRYQFTVDGIAQAEATDIAMTMHEGDEVRVALDPQGDPAVYRGRALIGWPSRYRAQLKKCLEEGFKFPGRVIDRGGIRAPHLDVEVQGKS